MLNSIGPSKNSTLVIVPSISTALAATRTSAGAVNLEFLTGAVRLIVGGRLDGGLTVTLTVLEVVMAPELSVARAVIL